MAEQGVRACGGVMHAPRLDQHAGLDARIEHLGTEQLVAELAPGSSPEAGC